MKLITALRGERERERESNPKPPAPSFTKSSCHLCDGTIIGPVGVYCDLSWLWLDAKTN